MMKPSRRRVREALKRFMDCAMSAVLLAVLLVPLLLIMLAVRLESKGPALFTQYRAGKDGRIFKLYKIRSIKLSETQTTYSHQAQDVTRIGNLIRGWRIDEIPQFINIIKGEMSIVGPRPTLPYQTERYDIEQNRRLSVRPGLTGWSQIHGDSAIRWPDRIALDLWYVDNWSLWLDLKIMILTPFALLRIRKIKAEDVPPDEISWLPYGTEEEK